VQLFATSVEQPAPVLDTSPTVGIAIKPSLKSPINVVWIDSLVVEKADDHSLLGDQVTKKIKTANGNR
jgi:hypothetical protein